MITFVNDSGVIEVTDTSVSPPIIDRWLKDMLRIEQYVDIIRFTGTLEDAPGRKEYQLADEATAIAERQTLYEYLEDYGGGTPIDSYQGQMGRTTSGVVNIATAGTYQATGLIGTLDTIVSDGIALSTTDQLGLRNVSGKTVDFKIFASADIDANNNKILGIILAKNGTIIPETECRAPTGVGTSFAKLFTNWIIPMADGDQVTMYVTNHTTSGNITIDRCRMLAITSGGVSGNGGGGGVQSVTGLDTDNTDPANPVIQIAVDGVTITGDGTPGNPLVGASSSALEILDNGVSVDANVDEINFIDAKVTQTAAGKVDVAVEGYQTFLYEFYNY
jgi:hypothetical protein